MMRTAVVVDRFPAETETFIRRHVDGLGADVFAPTMEGPELHDWNPPPYVACVRRGVPRREPLAAWRSVVTSEPAHGNRRLMILTTFDWTAMQGVTSLGEDLCASIR